MTAPTLDKTLEILRANEPMLRARGVVHAAVFGSVARKETHGDSDVDILVEIDPEKHIGLFGYAGLCEDIGDLFAVKVDVANVSSVRPYFRASIFADAVYAF